VICPAGCFRPRDPTGGLSPLRRPRHCIARHWIAGSPFGRSTTCDWLIVQQWIFHQLPLPVLLEQIVEGLDGQGVDGGIPLNCQHPKRSPSIHPHPGQNLLEGLRVFPGGRPRCLWLAEVKEPGLCQQK
jgi:hypothetical protein